MTATSLRRPMRIGALEVPNRAFLAPLAGVSDAPFRRICQEHGAGLTFVEMLSAVAIRRANDRTKEMRGRHPDEPLLGVQLTGPSAEDVAAAVGLLDAEGFDVIDLNMGCPVRKVVGTGCGSGYLQDPERMSRTLEAARERTQRPLTAKTRLGFAKGDLTIDDAVRRVAAAGADLLTVHGRRRADRYDVDVDLAGIRVAVDTAPDGFPVVGNGDVFDLPSAERMLRETGCAAVMVSRGALGNPWIFRELLGDDDAAPSLEEWTDVVLRHLDYQAAHYADERLGAILFRKQLGWYARGFPGARKLRDRLSVVSSIADAREEVKRFAAHLPNDLSRLAA